MVASDLVAIAAFVVGMVAGFGAQRLPVSAWGAFAATGLPPLGLLVSRAFC